MEYSALKHKDGAVIESLISINNQLQDPAAAAGVLVDAQRSHDLRLQSSLYEVARAAASANCALRDHGRCVDPREVE